MALLNLISLQMFLKKIKISPTVLSINLAEHLQISKKMSFICKDKHISDNNTKNEGGIWQWEMNCVNENLVENSRYYGSDKSSHFCEALCWFNILS